MLDRDEQISYDLLILKTSPRVLVSLEGGYFFNSGSFKNPSDGISLGL